MFPVTMTPQWVQQRSYKSYRTLCVGAVTLLALAFLYNLGYAVPRAPSAYATGSTIFNATLGFGAIFAISMPHRTDHQDSLILAAANSDIHIDFIDGLPGDAISDHALPSDTDRGRLGQGNIGSWRAHMNALQRVVANNISSALILEDDVDWDMRIKSELFEFAKGVRALTQPLKGSEGYADPTFETRASADEITPLNYDLTPESAPNTIDPITSPYGDHWDLLWVGHCGVRFPRPEQTIPKGRYVIEDDETVLSFEHRNTLHDEIKEQYKDHTRIISHAMGPICTLGYAVSQLGARRILQKIGVDSFTAPVDNLLADFCDHYTCMVSQPQYFNHWRAPGSGDRDSEINDMANGQFREVGYSDNIRQSVRMNSHRILDGASDFVDQWPDQAT